MWDLRLHQPATIQIVGSSGSGKTTLMSKLCRFKHILFDKQPEFVLLCYSQDQNIYKELYNEGFLNKMIHGYPSFRELTDLIKPHKKNGSLIIIDDGLNAVNNDLEKIFFELSHHLNSTVIFISQSLFHQSKEMRTVSLNTQYLFYMRNPRNKRQIFDLARQISPYRANYIVEAFEKATRLPFSYLLINMHQLTPLVLMLTTDIFPDEPKPIKAFLENQS